MPRGDRLALGPSYVAAALWRRHGYGRGCALPFWAAPVSRIDALARQGGGEFELGYLDCVAEAAKTRRPRTRSTARRRAPDRRAAGQAPAPGCTQPAPSRCASRWSPARLLAQQARYLAPRRAGSRYRAGRCRRAARDDRTGGLAGVRRGLRVQKNVPTGSRSARCGPPPFRPHPPALSHCSIYPQAAEKAEGAQASPMRLLSSLETWAGSGPL